MHLSQHKLCTRKMGLALEVKLDLDFHGVTRPWRRTLTNGSDVKYVFPRCRTTPYPVFPTTPPPPPPPPPQSYQPVLIVVLVVGSEILCLPFHSQEWSMSNFPCSLTRNMTPHSMKNLAFHFLNVGVKGLNSGWVWLREHTLRLRGADFTVRVGAGYPSAPCDKHTKEKTIKTHTRDAYGKWSWVLFYP